MNVVPHRAAASVRLGIVFSFLALVVTGCTGGAASARGGASAGGAPAELAPSRGPASRYGADPGTTCPSGPLVATVMSDLADAAARAGRPAPVLDPAVCGVAETFFAWDPEAVAAVRPQVLAFASHWFGLPAPIAPPMVATLQTPDEKLVAERIVQAVGNAVLNAAHARLGLALRPSGNERNPAYRVAVAILDAPVELDPLPRQIASGQRVKLSGRLLAPVKDPRVLLSDAAGRLSTPEQPPGHAFEAELTCGDRAGTIRVEIRGEQQGRSRMVASFPVWCGERPPDRIAVAAEPWPTAPEQAARRMLELVNAERATVGVAPLVWDDGVARVARAIAEESASRGGAAPGTGVAERLERVGVISALVLQSAAADRTFERAHTRLLASPSNRANLMSPEVTNAGIGAVRVKDAQGHDLVYVAELLVRVLPPVDVGRLRAALRDAVAQKRKDARTNALKDDPTLDATAQRYAEALAAAGGTLSKEKHGELTAPLNKGFKSVTMVSGAKPEPLDFAEEPQTTAPAKGLGVGVAQGNHPVLGRNATYVVLMVGTPRAADAPARRKAAAKKPR